MPLSWNEIKDRARAFSREWADEASEDAEAKSFRDAFFEVFGVPRRRVASFERRIKKVDEKDRHIGCRVSFLFERYQAMTSLLKASERKAYRTRLLINA